MNQPETIARRNLVELGNQKPETEFQRRRVSNSDLPSGSEGSYQLANLVVIAGGYKNHPIALYAKR
jgi:hypothetical protein